MKKVVTYNVQICCGLKETFKGGRTHTIKEVKQICDEFVNEYGDCVSITKTDFRYTNGNEPGVVIGFISYPRFPRLPEKIRNRAFILAEKLMLNLNQYKVSIVDPYYTYMLENDNLNNERNNN